MGGENFKKKAHTTRANKPLRYALGCRRQGSKRINSAWGDIKITNVLLPCTDGWEKGQLGGKVKKKKKLFRRPAGTTVFTMLSTLLAAVQIFLSLFFGRLCWLKINYRIINDEKGHQRWRGPDKVHCHKMLGKEPSRTSKCTLQWQRASKLTTNGSKFP